MRSTNDDLFLGTFRIFTQKKIKRSTDPWTGSQQINKKHR